MTADLVAVTAAANTRRDAQTQLDDAVQALHGAIRAAHTDRWRVADLADASGLHRVTIHQILRDTAGTRPAV
ncbi:MAG: hypothetical protein ACOH17_14270 [Cellulomonas sp.]